MADEKTTFALAAAERRRAADMFEGLTDEQWATPSLCAQWTVRDIAGHLVGGLDISMARFVAGSLIWGGMHRYNARRSRQIARRPTSELVAALRSRADGWCSGSWSHLRVAGGSCRAAGSPGSGWPPPTFRGRGATATKWPGPLRRWRWR
jgi:uncharacterized protein (TIGR03083 family)